MIAIDKKLIPPEILKDSILVHLASAYFSVSKQLEQKTKCSETRGFIMSTLRGGAALNPNQISKLLGFDRTVVHRAIKTMIREGLLTQKKPPPAEPSPSSSQKKATSTATRWSKNAAKPKKISANPSTPKKSPP